MQEALFPNPWRARRSWREIFLSDAFRPKAETGKKTTEHAGRTEAGGKAGVAPRVIQHSHPGFTRAPLYMFPENFESLVVALLLNFQIADFRGEVVRVLFMHLSWPGSAAFLTVPFRPASIAALEISPRFPKSLSSTTRNRKKRPRQPNKFYGQGQQQQTQGSQKTQTGEAEAETRRQAGLREFDPVWSGCGPCTAEKGDFL